jgi:hypothetical protein
MHWSKLRLSVFILILVSGYSTVQGQTGHVVQVVRNISDHPVCAILTIDAQTPLLYEEGIISRFMISSLGNGPVSGNKVPKFTAPAGRHIHSDSLCRPVGAQGTRRNPNPRLTPWAGLISPLRGWEKFGLV